MSVRLTMIVAGIALAAAPLSAGAETAPDAAVRIVLKFVKRSPGRGVRFDRASCAPCEPVDAINWNADNAREAVVALDVPRMRHLELAFDGAASNVRRVVLEGGDIPFRRDGDRLIVAVPPVGADAITAGEVATHIVEAGMVLRFEHADPVRRAGAYATGPFPTVQRAAANVLEFAQREVVRELGLGVEVEKRGLGRIQIMGFDTNAPHDHTDFPPHMHMHLRWPQNTGTQIGHYYIGADGLLDYNLVGVKGLGMPQRRFDRGTAFTTIGPDGAPVYTHTITREGWLDLGRAGQPPCAIRPAGADGFAGGATIACPQQPVRRITVTDDIARGVLTVDTDGIRETFRYDPDTGRLLSPDAVPPPRPSVFAGDR